MDQATQQESSPAAPGTRAAAFSVHIFTAMGAGVALIALLEAVREHWAAMFAWLGVALVIDAVDGPIARRLDVARVQPDWSGEVLDLVVDFVTYVFVPAYAITASTAQTPISDSVSPRSRSTRTGCSTWIGTNVSTIKTATQRLESPGRRCSRNR